MNIKTGNKFAITTGDLAEGLRTGGAALAVTNNDLYESEALITAGTEVKTLFLINKNASLYE